MVVEVIVTENQLDPSDLMTIIDSVDVGAIASFVGIVRASHGDEEVMGLEFEAWGSRLPAVLRKSERRQLNKRT